MIQNRSGFLNSIPPVTKNIIIINLILWLAQVALATKGVDIVRYGGLHYFESPYFYPHQIMTYMFLHGGFQHLFFNMFAVFMFGRTLETIWGPKRFLFYYIFTGIGAGLVNLLVAYFRIYEIKEMLTPEMISEVYLNGARILDKGLNYPDPTMGGFNILLNTSTIGASGAVFGILVAFGMILPNAELFIIPFPFPIKAKYFVIGYGVIELFLGILNNPTDNVAHFAHLGGLVFGFFMILYWKSKNNASGKFF